MSLTSDLKALLKETGGKSESASPTGKIGLDNLGADVLELINTSQTITLELPSAARVQVPEAKNQPAFLKIVDDLMAGNNVFLVGEAGTGKTTIAEKIAFATKGMREEDYQLEPDATKEKIAEFRKQLPYITINCHQWTTPTDLIGGQTMDGYKQGKMITAWTEGKLLILDEMPKLDSNTAGILNDALAKTAKPGAVIFDGNSVPHAKHPDFGVIATGNTTGKRTSVKYGGNNQQDASLIDRFSGSYYFIEFNRKLEQSLVHKVVFEVLDKMRIQLIAMDSDEIITLRTMLNMNRIYQLEMERKTGNIASVAGGKTLKDSLESYFAAMDADEAEELRDKVDMQSFYGSYDDVEVYLDDKKRFG